MKAKLLILGLIMLAFSCGRRHYFVAEVQNSVFRPNTVFQSMEDLSNPGFSHLIEKYQLDTIVHGESDEFGRILLLRHWIKTVIPINDHDDPYPGDGYAEGILDAALEGQGFHCGHFMTVQNAIMNAYGYITRCLGAGPGVKGQDGPDGHHGINEIWLNQYHKWVLSDAKYNHHFEKNGIPLSALEVRDEYLKNKAADIVVVNGPDRKVIDFDNEVKRSKEQFARTYTWITWKGNGNYFIKNHLEGDMEDLRKFGPKTKDHPSVGKECPACHIPFREGDYTTLIPLGPGDDKEAQMRCRAGRPYNAIAVEIHYTCATGKK